MARATSPVIEGLEQRTLLSSTLPFVLNFNQSAGGIFDATGQGTGFTAVEPNKLSTEYQPNLIHLNTAAGELDFTTVGTTTSGSNYESDNTQVNALQTTFDGTTSGFTLTTRLKGPLSQIAAPYEQAGIFFGPDQDNWVKIVAIDMPAKGQVLQFTDEQNRTTHAILTYTNIGNFASANTLDLRLTGDAATGQVFASYSLNGGAFIAATGAVTFSGAEKAAFFNANSVGGIFDSSKNNLAPISVGFTHFEIDPGTVVTNGPSVLHTDPVAGAVNVPRDGFVSVDLHLPNGGLSIATVTNSTVTLKRNSDGTIIPAVVNSSGGGDAIVLQPSVPLDANTTYTFTITNGVKDRSGAAFAPFTMNFTTGTMGGNVDPSIAFDHVALPTTTGDVFTCLKIGPDGKLYASNQDGRIFIYSINADGTLSSPQIVTALQTAEGGQRLVSGFAFDPTSTAANPIIWVSNGFYGQTNAPDWDGKITKMSGPNLATVQDMVIHLPRSILNHMTNTPAFGPDGALYIPQGSNTAYGAPDPTWGNRQEHLLNAAILRLDTTKLPVGTALDVRTPDGGGTYNPFAAGAALTLYATGVRNAFDILWDDSGNLWAPTNGTASGGSTPAFDPTNASQINGRRIDTGLPYAGPAVPGETKIDQTEPDWLFNIKPGRYYGHPDPVRGEYVANGGNPTVGVDPEEMSGYPVGVKPDANYSAPAYIFGNHHSPDGIIEYHGSAFGGKLDGKLLVTEYSGGNDVLVLTRGPNGTITNSQRGFSGFTGFVNPLSIVEDPNSGFLYVSEYGGARVTLLKPHVASPVGGTLTADKPLVVFSDIATSFSGGPGASPSQTITLTNTGTGTITFPSSGALSIIDDTTVAGNDAGAFSIVNAASMPGALSPGQSFVLQVNYTASLVGIQAAILQINSSDAAQPTLSISLHGIGTTGLGGANEPSLPRILRAFNIPTITGDGPNDANQNQTFYPTTPDPSSQEVVMPRLVKAGTGPVTITPLASYNVSMAPAMRFGYYTPGTPADRTELFTFSQADAQTTDPTALGATIFDPGSATFGLWAQFPHFIDSGQQRVAYSEDVLNTWDANVHRKMRFFPLENPDGSVVPNAYILEAEDYNLQYDSNDIVAIIRNVKPAANAVGSPAIGISNSDGIPYADRLIFSRIQNQDPVNGDTVHDTDTLIVRNTGTQPLTIGSLNVTDPTSWLITPSQPLTTPIAPGASITLTIKFIATKAPVHSDNQTNDTGDYEGIPLNQVSGTWNDTLTIASNDPAVPAKLVQLSGYWQHASGKEEEPGLQTTVNLIAGYGTVISPTRRPNFPNASPTTPTFYGEEINSPYWVVADPSQPVSATQIGSYHNQNTSTSLFWYAKTTGTPVRNRLFTTAADEGQSVLPHVTGSTTKLASATFNPGAVVFGWNIDGYYSDDTVNTKKTHQVRIFPLRDRSGNIVPNSWIISNDYISNTGFQNNDFQDNVYVITNARPALAPGTPTDLQAVATSGGVLLEWAPVSFTGGVAYNVSRATSSAGTYALLTGSPISATSFVDTSAASGTTYFYKIVAVGAGNVQSVPATAFTTATNTTTATPPTGTPALSGLPASNSIALSWTPIAGATSYRIQRKGTDGLFHDLAFGITGTGYTDGSLTSSTAYTYQVRAENSAGVGPYSAAATFTTTAAQQTSLTSVDIGTTTVGSTTAVGTGGYDVVAGGTDIYNTADSFRFAYRQQTGDFDVKVQVTSLDAASSIDAKAGLMARTSLNANSAMIFSGTTAADGYRYTARASSGAAVTNVHPSAPLTFPNVWVRLTRVGNVFTAYHSTDGVTWTVTSSVTLALPTTIFLGLATTGHSATGTTTAQYRNFAG
ncbi:MAG TPA: Ig-like domain-containing protein [Humisphaera sp.]|jgi:glucose/arabinose dehydrogenase/regulation of enolase protein 1 (concanavalin A-like superfamily)|nr:Ig-like domain-containing protein [Humisphaera sp.]